MADTPKVQSLDDVMRWLDRLERATQVQSTNAWAMSAVLEHMAQSVDMSLDGFPQPRSALFQSTLGAAAYLFPDLSREEQNEVLKELYAASAQGDPGAIKGLGLVFRWVQKINEEETDPSKKLSIPARDIFDFFFV